MVHMAPSGLVWKTWRPRGAERPWTRADLACGMGGFTIAAQSLGASATWACDINREATQAYNVAHAHARTSPAKCHPIGLRSQLAQHVGTDLISAGFPCQAFSKVGKRHGHRDARGQVIFHLIQLCWVLRSSFMVLECVWPFFENPQWLEPVSEYFRGMGYGFTIGKQQASDYLAQIRTRGILTATKHDFWHLVTGPLMFSRERPLSGAPPWRPQGCLGRTPPRTAPSTLRKPK